MSLSRQKFINISIKICCINVHNYNHLHIYVAHADPSFISCNIADSQVNINGPFVHVVETIVFGTGANEANCFEDDEGEYNKRNCGFMAQA
jgi:hypothetical protein